MESTSSEIHGGPAPITSGSRQVNIYPWKGFVIASWMHGEDFSFHVKRPAAEGGETLFESGANYPNNQRAELAAEKWISDRLAKESADAVEQAATDQRVAVLPAVEIGGWQIEVFEEMTKAGVRRGTYEATVASVADENGNIDTVDGFKGYQSADLAMEAAADWARTNVRGAAAPETAVQEAPPPPALPAASEPPCEPTEPAPALVPATEATPPAQVPALVADRRQPNYDEAHELARQRAEACRELADLEEQKASLVADIKAKGLRIALLDKRVNDLLLGRIVGTQAELPLSPAPREALPFGSTPAAGEAAQVGADRLKPATFKRTIIGKERTFECRELEAGRWRAFVRGHEGDTEGFGVTYDEAVSNADGRASLLFADCEPGASTPSADTGAVADGPRPAEPKAKLRGKSSTWVKNAMRLSMSLNEAAGRIGCTEPELEVFAKTHLGGISKHLGAAAGQDEPGTKRRGKRGGR